MWRRLTVSMVALVALSAQAYAGNPHFISCSQSVQGAEVCVSGKEAGLGDEAQISLTLSVVAHCQNRGGQDPNAANKAMFDEDFTRPTQNGKALYEVCVTTVFKPTCSPPMTVLVDSVTLIDTTNNLACVLD